MAIFLNRPVRPLLTFAREKLGMSQRQLGEALGASERTAQRWDAGQLTPTVKMVCTLARLVYPRDAALAAELAAAASETLESLGMVPPQARVAMPSRELVRDTIACAAAEAMKGAPSVASAAVVAALARARELGVSAGDVEELLATR